MHTEQFSYHRAESVKHAVELLETSDDARILAGGQGLIPLMKKRELTPDALVDITQIDELRGIERTDDTIRIGGLSTHREIADSALLKETAPVVPRTVAHITGGQQVHNVATIGGNIARAHPGYDYEGALLSTGSQIVVSGPAGKQRVPVSEFVRGPCSTTLAETQLVTSIEIPVLSGDRRGGYAKKKEPASGNAIVGVATDLLFDDDQSTLVKSARIAVNGLQGCAVRLDATENRLEGKQLTPDRLEAAADDASSSLDSSAVLDNKKASAEYRLCLLEPQVQKSIRQAVGERTLYSQT
ncbi:xanthine dehydrogenase family protein subunit M [Halobacteriales archaeon QS_4_66_20]|nr:MAG: xanthine dehydrogenase family protein subunit M [Halobacteriales archaeon QS_4_66_20]